MSFTDVLLIILCVIIGFHGLFIIGIYGVVNKLLGMFTFMSTMVCDDEQDSGDH